MWGVNTATISSSLPNKMLILAGENPELNNIETLPEAWDKPEDQLKRLKLA